MHARRGDSMVTLQEAYNMATEYFKRTENHKVEDVEETSELWLLYPEGDHGYAGKVFVVFKNGDEPRCESLGFLLDVHEKLREVEIPDEFIGE